MRRPLPAPRPPHFPLSPQWPPPCQRWCKQEVLQAAPTAAAISQDHSPAPSARRPACLPACARSGRREGEGPVPLGLDPKVVEVYRGVGKLLSRYKAGKVGGGRGGGPGPVWRAGRLRLGSSSRSRRHCVLQQLLLGPSNTHLSRRPALRTLAGPPALSGCCATLARAPARLSCCPQPCLTSGPPRPASRHPAPPSLLRCCCCPPPGAQGLQDHPQPAELGGGALPHRARGLDPPRPLPGHPHVCLQPQPEDGGENKGGFGGSPVGRGGRAGGQLY